MNELHAGSGSVAAFPSESAARMAVTGRQKLKKYFASQAQMAASASAMFMSAKRRALSASAVPRSVLTCCAMRFQCPGGVSVPAPSAQNSAMSSCSAVRADPTAAPSNLTSFKSAAQRAESSAGGPCGRKKELVGMANGDTNPHCGNRYGASAGGVGCHTPGPEPDGGATIASALSLARAVTIWRPTSSPHSIPARFCGLSAMPPRIPVLTASKLVTSDGKSADSTAWAAALPAATTEALAGTPLGTT